MKSLKLKCSFLRLISFFLICITPIFSTAQNKGDMPPPPPPPPPGLIPFSCIQRNDDPCNLIKNSNFTIACTDPNTTINNAIPFYNCVNYWTSSHGTPQLNFNITAPPISPGVNHACMWTDATINANGNIISNGEGIAIGIPKLTINTTYALEFFKKFFSAGITGGPDIDDFYVVLLTCAAFNNIRSFPLEQDYSIPNIPSTGAQIIYHEMDMNNVVWQNIKQTFVANAEYDVLWIFPKSHTAVPGMSLTSWLEVAQPKISTLPLCGPIGCIPPVVTPAGPIEYYTPLDAGPYGVTLTSNFSTGNQWYFRNQPITGATNSTLVINWNTGYGSDINGLYYTKVNGCISNVVDFNELFYGYGWLGEEPFHFGAKMHPVNSPNYYCLNTTDKIRLFDLGPTATYSWAFYNYANPGSPTNITLNNTTYNPHSPVADVNIGGGNNITDLVRGVASTTSGTQKIIDYYLWQSPVINPSTGTYIYTCQDMIIDILATNGTFYSTWYELPGSSYFDWEQYEFGPNTTLVNTSLYGNYVISSNPLIIKLPGKNPQSVPIKVKFTGPSYIHKTFSYNPPSDGCAREDYNVVEWLPGCLGRIIDPGDSIKRQVVTIYPNPATTQVSINTKDAFIQSIEIIDLFGPTIRKVKVNNEKSITVNITALKSGIYTCKVTTNKGVDYQKLIIKRN